MRGSMQEQNGSGAALLEGAFGQNVQTANRISVGRQRQELAMEQRNSISGFRGGPAPSQPGFRAARFGFGPKLSRLRALFSLLLLASTLACDSPPSSPDPDGKEPPSQNKPDDGGDGKGGDGDGDGDGTDGGDGGEVPEVEVSIRLVSPPYGPLSGGTLVVLEGSGFVKGFANQGGRQSSELTEISFGSNPSLDVNVIDDDTLEVRSPAGVAGEVDISLKNPNGEFVCEGCFAYIEPIDLSRVSPDHGSSEGGELISVEGNNLRGVVQLLVGGAAAYNLQIAADGKSLSAYTPPGTPGGADVELVARNSSALLPRAYRYQEPLAIHGLYPVVVDVKGGQELVIEGQGFGPASELEINGQPVDVRLISSSRLEAKAPLMSEGWAEVTLRSEGQEASLEQGFLYVDAANRSLQLLAVAPAQGPVSGGSCASGTGCVQVFGTGLDSGVLQLRIGGADAPVARIVDELSVEVDLPPGEPGLALIQARNARGSDELADAFAYVEALQVDEITPDRVPAGAADPTLASLKGSGFSAECEVFVGPQKAEVKSVNSEGTRMEIELPATSEGSRDLLVRCEDSSGNPLLARETRVKGALRYVAPLALYQVEASTGSMAGNTRVTLLGAGFEEGMSVLFGTREALELEVLSPHKATLRTPPGDRGFVDVSATLPDGQSARLGGAYGYLNPTNSFGGASGGPMRGTLNVSVLNGTYGMRGPVPGATVSINGGQLVGTTDSRGQVTFSDGMLLKPVTISATKDMFSTTTIARIDARNVSLFIEVNDGDGDPPSVNPSEPQEPSELKGRVCGFKTPPRFELSETQRLEARVRMAPRHVYSSPPFASLPRPFVVEEDCGEFSFRSSRFGVVAFYAEFGVADDEDGSFTPWLMGIAREVESIPGKSVDDIMILLDMHRDQEIPVRIEPPDAPPGMGLMHHVYSYLELGGTGVVPLTIGQSRKERFSLSGQPRVSGDGVMFLALSAPYDEEAESIASPYSYYFRRQLGDLRQGVNLGPMLEFSRITVPISNGVFDGRVAWELLGGEQAHFQHIVIQEPVMFTSRMIWEVILPGGERTVTLPPEVLSRLESGSRLYLTLTTSRTSNFDFNRFSYDQLGLTSRLSYTQNFTSFQVP